MDIGERRITPAWNEPAGSGIKRAFAYGGTPRHVQVQGVELEQPLRRRSCIQISQRLGKPEGVTVEVKSSAYLQKWHQDQLSRISFVVPKTRAWDPCTNQLSNEAARQAQVYVFALLAHLDKATVDPLDLNQWIFYVLPTEVLNGRTRSQHSITLRTLHEISGGPVAYNNLRVMVLQAAKRHTASNEGGSYEQAGQSPG